MEATAKKVVRAGFTGATWQSKMNGASFCHVDKMSPVVKSSPWRMSGSQAWTGARPTFRARAIVRKAAGRGWKSNPICHCVVRQAFNMVAKRIREAAVAWVR